MAAFRGWESAEYLHALSASTEWKRKFHTYCCFDTVDDLLLAAQLTPLREHG